MSPATMPSELASFVISHLLVPDDPKPADHIQEHARIAMYATVSKEWQKSVERHTFSNLHLTPARIEEFGRIVHKHRRRYVRHIDLDVVLDSYDEAACGRYESDEDQERNNQVFTQMFQKLFKTMRSWEDGHVADLGVTLSIKVYSPSDLSRLGQIEARARRKRLWGPKDVFDRRFDKSYLQFICPEKEGDENHLLDSVPAINHIYIEGGYLRHIWPASCSTIVSKAPQLRSFNARLWDDEKRDLELRKRARNKFANSIKIWSPLVQKVDLSYYDLAPQDESFMPPNILTGPSTEDLLSTSLGKFSQQLTELRLDDITIGAEFFWSLVFDAHPPYWPHLTLLVINYNPITPSGQWLLERDPSQPIEEIDYGEDPSLYISVDELPVPQDRRVNRFRHKASPVHMNKLYTAAGKAACFMPALREIWLSASSTGYWPHWFAYKATPTNAYATWGSTPEFKPDESVLDVWREVSKNLGVDLQVKYEDGM